MEIKEAILVNLVAIGLVRKTTKQYCLESDIELDNGIKYAISLMIYIFSYNELRNRASKK